MKSFILKNTRTKWQWKIWRWNGYVILDKTNKYYWEDYDDIPVQVSWWLTFWKFGRDIVNPKIKKHCKEDDYVVWFDTCHTWDFFSCNKEFVKQETEKLTNQLKTFSSLKTK